MIFSKISRIPKRIQQDFKIISLTKNWNEILMSKVTQSPLLSIKLRNGVVLDSPVEASLNFLFHEIWLDEVYAPRGYEIKPHDIIIDIGGNIGIFALYAATKAPGVRVFSFEPFPQNAEYFERNLTHSHLDNVTLYHQAVGAESVERVLHVHDSWIKHSLTDDASDKAGIKVECISLDRALKDFDRCNLMKLDCEGSEYEILYSSSAETLKKVEKIVGEFHNIDDEQKNGAALRKFLEEHDFKIDVFRPLDEKSGFICAKRG